VRQETCGTIIEYDEDVTATEATKADGGALGMRSVTFDELDAHREESPDLIGSEAVDDIGKAGEMFWAIELELPLGRERHFDVHGVTAKLQHFPSVPVRLLSAKG
jgi:hypothetical protein